MKNDVDPFKTDHSSLSEAVSRLREEEGMTQKALAQKIGCSEISIEKFEKGENFSLILLYQICNVLNISFMDLLRNSANLKDE